MKRIIMNVFFFFYVPNSEYYISLFVNVNCQIIFKKSLSSNYEALVKSSKTVFFRVILNLLYV